MKLLNALEKILVLAVVIFVPLSFAPVFLAPFDPVKLTVLTFLISLLIIIFCLKVIIRKSVFSSSGNFDRPILLLTLAYLAAAIFKTPNKMEAFFLPGTASVILLAAVFFFLAKNLANKKQVLSSGLFLGAVAVAVISLLAAAGVLAKIPQLPAFVKDTAFSPLGSKLAEAIFLASLFPLGVGLIFSAQEMVKKTFWLVSLGIVTLALALSAFTLLPGKPGSPTLPAWSTSWSIAIDTLKSSPVLGIGPGNYLTAYNRFRPLSHNQTALWAYKFTGSRSFVLTLISETGLLGLLGLALIIFSLAKNFKHLEIYPALSLSLALFFGFLFPSNLSLILILFGLLALTALVKESSFPLPGSLPFFLAAPILAAILVLAYFGNRALKAENTFKKSAEALAKNEGKSAYDQMRQAITLNPYVDRYHLSYSQVNLALARALAQKKDLTDEDRNTVTQLISQAIREGKSGVALNRQKAANWEILARTYQSISAFAQGADSFTIQSYNQAIALDPINPNLRISLGGVYYALGRYDEAIDTFKLAVLTKQDLANAHYNLAIALREKGEIKKATDEMNTVLSLVGKDSADWETAKKELEKLESLTAPQPAEKPVIKPPIELPQEATPPVQE
jgi:tetratricopeptide (TPR) repeat protein